MTFFDRRGAKSAGRLCGAMVLMALSCGIAQAQQYLGQMPAADCRQRGGSPDSSITDDDNPDPVRGCWKHFTSGPSAGDASGSNGGGSTVTGTVVTPGGGGTNTAGVALQIGGAALNILGQIIEALDSGGSDQAAPQEATASMAEVNAIKEQEADILRTEAHQLNEQGQQAAADGKTAIAMVSFQHALDNAQQIGDNDNSTIYRNNMNTMRAYMAYDTGLRAWNNGRYDAARKSFKEAIHYAQTASQPALARKLAQGVAALPTGKGGQIDADQGGQGICMQINGEIVCE